MAEASPRRSRSPIERAVEPDRAPRYGRIYHLRIINEDNGQPHFFSNLISRNYDCLVDDGYTIVTMWSDDNLCHILYHKPPGIVTPPPVQRALPDPTFPNVPTHSPPWSIASSYGSMPSLESMDAPPRDNNDSPSR
jgi:hypothetical protein